jgi:hypothetical protein
MLLVVYSCSDATLRDLEAGMTTSGCRGWRLFVYSCCLVTCLLLCSDATLRDLEAGMARLRLAEEQAGQLAEHTREEVKHGVCQ